jgi:hypothetical protein
VVALLELQEQRQQGLQQRVLVVELVQRVQQQQVLVQVVA